MQVYFLGVRLYYAGLFFGSVCPVQMKFGIRLRYAGLFLGSVYTMPIDFSGVPSTLCRSIFGVRLGGI